MPASLNANPQLSPAAADVVHRNLTVSVFHADSSADTFHLDMINPTLTFPILQGELYSMVLIDVNAAGFSSQQAMFQGVPTAPAGTAPATPVILGCVFTLA